MTYNSSQLPSPFLSLTDILRTPKDVLDTLSEISQVSKKSVKTDTHKDFYYSLPGVDESRLSLEYEEGVLTLAVEPLTDEQKREAEGPLAFPRGYRTMDYVGTDVDPDKIEAGSELGILKVSFTIKENKNKRSIPVSTAK